MNTHTSRDRYYRVATRVTYSNENRYK